MPILTLTTDWGLRDHHVAAFKGEILTNYPDASIVDISHEVERFNTLQAAFILKSAFEKFPAGTIHYIGMNGKGSSSHVETENNYLIVTDSKYAFIGFDNGIFSLVLGNNFNSIYRLPIDPGNGQNEAHEIVMGCINSLLHKKKPSSIGTEHPAFIQSYFTNPTVDADSLQGTVLFIDSFGNAIVNIKEQLFDEQRRGRDFSIYLRKSKYDIHKISKSYEDSPEGEIVALFNRESYLEIALNRESAEGLLGMKILDPIRIEFHDH